MIQLVLFTGTPILETWASMWEVQLSQSHHILWRSSGHLERSQLTTVSTTRLESEDASRLLAPNCQVFPSEVPDIVKQRLSFLLHHFFEFWMHRTREHYKKWLFEASKFGGNLLHCDNNWNHWTTCITA